MHVKIDHGHPAHGSLPLKGANRDRHVVDETETLAVIGERVVKAAAQVHRDPPISGEPTCEGGPAGAEPGGLAQRGREGHLEQQLLLDAQSACLDLPHVVGRMDQRDLLVRCGRWQDDIDSGDGAFGEQPVPHQAVLPRREDVRPDVDLIGGVVDDGAHAGFG